MSGKPRPRAWCEDCLDSKAIDVHGCYWPHNPAGISMWEGVGHCPGSGRQVIAGVPDRVIHPIVRWPDPDPVPPDPDPALY